MPPNLIMDQSYNQLVNNTTAQGLGYTEQESSEILNLDMYRFIIASIRNEDEKSGSFLKRFLQGHQEIWETIQSKIFDIKDLWDISEIKDGHLQYLQAIVGWVGDLTKITDTLDSDTLRRLISTSTALWRERGPEDAIIDVLSLTTQAQSRIWNWFDYRWILEETGFAEELQGRDLNMIDLPGQPGYEEYQSNLRIVDNGNLDKTLVKNLVKLMRACSERITISYIDFMELFSVDDDKTQWTENSGELIVADGVGKLADNTMIEMAHTTKGLPLGAGGPQWTKQVIYARIRAVSRTSTGFVGITFCSDGTDQNHYSFSIDPYINGLIYVKTQSGVVTGFNFIQYTSWGQLYDDIWYGVRVDFQSPTIKIYVDNDLVMTVTDSTFTEGTIGIYHQVNCAIEVDEIEMFLLPSETEDIGINE